MLVHLSLKYDPYHLPGERMSCIIDIKTTYPTNAKIRPREIIKISPTAKITAPEIWQELRISSCNSLRLIIS